MKNRFLAAILAATMLLGSFSQVSAAMPSYYDSQSYENAGYTSDDEDGEINLAVIANDDVKILGSSTYIMGSIYAAGDIYVSDGSGNKIDGLFISDTEGSLDPGDGITEDWQCEGYIHVNGEGTREGIDAYSGKPEYAGAIKDENTSFECSYEEFVVPEIANDLGDVEMNVYHSDPNCQPRTITEDTKFGVVSLRSLSDPCMTIDTTNGDVNVVIDSIDWDNSANINILVTGDNRANIYINNVDTFENITLNYGYDETWQPTITGNNENTYLYLAGQDVSIQGGLLGANVTVNAKSLEVVSATKIVGDVTSGAEGFGLHDGDTSITGTVCVPNAASQITSHSAIYGPLHTQSLEISNGSIIHKADGAISAMEIPEIPADMLTFDAATGTITDHYRGLGGAYAIPSAINGVAVTGISATAFRGWSGITSITIPESVTYIQDGAFQYSSIRSINVSEDNDYFMSVDGVLFSKDKTTLITYPCRKSGDYIIPDGVITIEDDAFTSCEELTSITIPDSVISVGECLFRDCSSLSRITLHDNITSIGREAFANTAFYNNEDNWENGVLYIGSYLIYADSSLLDTEYTVKEGTTCIADSAFNSCVDLTSIIIPDSVIYIGKNVFDGCSGLSDISISGEIEYMGCNSFYNTAFYNNESNWENDVLYIGSCLIQARTTLSGEYAIKDGTTCIVEDAFSGCESLNSIIMPDSIITIGDRAFYRCGINDIIIPDGAVSIGNSAFQACYYLTDITIPQSITYIDDSAFFECRSLSNINVNENNDIYSSIDGNLFDKYQTKLIRYAIGKVDSEYTIPDGVISIGSGAFRSCENMTSIIIPDSVVYIEDSAFSECHNLESISMPDTVTYIGDTAFFECTSLTDINIPDSITAVNFGTFWECDSLAGITIPENVTSIGDWAFQSCDSLTSITIPNSVKSIGGEAFYACVNLESITIPDGVTDIKDSTFGLCSNLKIITIPDSITSIGFAAFSACSNLTDIYYKGSAEAWGNISIDESNDTVFSTATMHYNSEYIPQIPADMLTFDAETGTITACDESLSGAYAIPSEIGGVAVTGIGEYAFSFCPGITSISIPDGVISIGVGAFEYITELEEINVSEDNSYFTSADEVLFNKDKTVLISYPCGKSGDYIIPDGVITIEDHAFISCEKLTGITIPASVTSIGERAFYYCSSLKNVEIPDGVTTIEEYAFSTCAELISIKVARSVTNIGEEVFSHCDNLVYADFENGITNIGRLMFYDSNNLSNIIIPESMTTIASHAFYACPVNDIYYSGTKEDWSNITIEAGNTTLETEEEFHFESDVQELIPFSWEIDENGTLIISGTGTMPNWNSYSVNQKSDAPWRNEISKIKSIKINEGITRIGDYAFLECSVAESVSIPDSVRRIGSYAFRNCRKLTEIKIPDSVTHIGSAAFYYCYGLTEIEIPDSVTVIGTDAFYDCKALTSIKFPSNITTIPQYVLMKCTSLKNVTIPDNVTRIAGGAFSWCSALESIHIPANITDIDDDAFKNCTSLTDVYYAGTKLKWDEITIGTNNTYLTNATIHFASAGSVVLSDDSEVITTGSTYTLTAEVTPEGTTVLWESSNTAVAAVEGGVVTAVAEGSAEITVYTELGATAVCKITVTDDPAPIAVDSFAASSGQQQIVLSWSIASQANAVGYVIYRSEGSDSGYSLHKTISSRNTLSFTDTGLKADTLYYYRIAVKDNHGRISDFAEVNALSQADTQPPQILSITPANMACISKTTRITVNAEDNIGIEKIILQYSNDDGATWNNLDEKSASYASFEFDTLIVLGSTVNIRALAYDVSGNVSDGTPVKLYNIDNTPPEKVTGLSLFSSSATIITLQWNDVTANDLSHFVVEEKSGSEFKSVGTVNSTLGINITGKVPATEYTYRVYAVDKYGNAGEYSDEVTVSTAQDTSAPVISSITPAAYALNSDIPLRISVKDDDRVEKLIVQTSADAETWTDNKEISCGAVQSKTVSYTLATSSYDEGLLYVRALVYDMSGNVSDSDKYYIGYLIDRTAPDAPQNVTASAASGSITVSWDLVSADDIKYYKLYREDKGLLVSNVRALSYIDSNVEAGISYSYTVSAVDNAGNESAVSMAVSATPLDDTEVPQITKVVPSGGSVINRSIPVKAAAVDNGGLDKIVLEYEADGEWTILSEADISATSGVLTYTPDADMLENSSVNMRFYAVDIAGNKSEYTQVSYTIDTTAPSVADTSVAAANESVTISWTSLMEADLAGYRVYYSENNGSYKYLGAVSNKNTQNYTYTHYPSTPGASYKYKISAVDSWYNAAEFTTDSVVFGVDENGQDISKPNAVMFFNEYMETGVEQYFDASGSYDESGISEFLWDFGDGNTSVKAKAAHAYETAGTFAVKLTVTDYAGNTTSVTRNVTVKEKQAIGTLKLHVMDENGNNVPNAEVAFDFSSENPIKYTTDYSGNLTLYYEPGNYTVAAYSSGYLPKQTDITLSANSTTEITLSLVKENIISGSFTAERMTLEEIKAAGIDITQPENHNVYNCTIKIDFGGAIGTTNVIAGPNISTTNRVTITDSAQKNHNCYVQVIVVPGGFVDTSNPDSGTSGDDQILVGVVEIPTEVSWLKEMFAAKLTIINNATPDFKLVDCVADINVPDGMTIIEGNGASSESRADMGTITGGETKSVLWYLRGDKAGQYNVSADFSGMLDGFNSPVQAHFDLDEPITVHGATNMKVIAQAEDRLVYGDDYTIRVGLKNEGYTDVYLPSVDISSDLFELNSMYKTKGNAPSDMDYEVLSHDETLWKEYTVPYDVASDSILNQFTKEDYEKYENEILFTNDSIEKYIQSIVAVSDEIAVETELIEPREINSYRMSITAYKDYETEESTERVQADSYSSVEMMYKSDSFPLIYEVKVEKSVPVDGGFQWVTAANEPVYITHWYLDGAAREAVYHTDTTGVAVVIPDSVPSEFSKKNSKLTLRANRTDAEETIIIFKGTATHGKFVGTVRNAKDEPMEGVTVTAIGSLLPITTQTDENGNYQLPEDSLMAKGSYTLKFEKAGYNTLKSKVNLGSEKKREDRVMVKYGETGILGVETFFKTQHDNGTKYYPENVGFNLLFKVHAVESDSDPIKQYQMLIYEENENGEETEIARYASNDADKLFVSTKYFTGNRRLRVYVITESNKICQRDVNIRPINLGVLAKSFIHSIQEANINFETEGKHVDSVDGSFFFKDISEYPERIQKMAKTVNTMLSPTRKELKNEAAISQDVYFFEGSKAGIKHTYDDKYYYSEYSETDSMNISFKYTYKFSGQQVINTKWNTNQNVTSIFKDKEKSLKSFYFEAADTVGTNIGLGVDASYISKYKSDGTWNETTKIKLSATGDWGHSWNIPVSSAGRVYMAANIDYGLRDEITENIISDKLYGESIQNHNIAANLNIKGSCGGALIHDKFLSGGVYAKLENTVYLHPDLYFQGRGLVGAEATVLFMNFQTDGIPLFTFTAGQNNASAAEAMLMSLSDENSVFTPQDRVNTKWKLTTATLMDVTEENSNTCIASDIFAGSQNSVSGGEKPMLLFVGDVEQRDSADRNAIMISEYTDGNFAEPTILDDDGTGDYQPFITQDGQAAVWTNISEVLGDIGEADLNEMQNSVYSKMGIKAAFYDEANGGFQNVQVISEEGYLNYAPHIWYENGKAYAVWIANKDNIMSLEANTGDIVMFAEFDGEQWSAPQQLYSGGTVMSVGVGADEGTPTVSYTVYDGTASKLYTITRRSRSWSTPSVLMKNGYDDGSHKFVRAGDETYLVFTSNNMLYVMNISLGTKPEKIFDGSDSGIQKFNVSGNDSGDILVTWVAGSDTQKVRVLLYNKDNVSDAYSINAVQNDNTVVSNAYAVLSNNGIIGVYNSSAYEEVDGIYKRQQVDLNMLRMNVDSDVTIAGITLESGVPLVQTRADIKVSVKNEGLGVAENVTVSLYNGDTLIEERVVGDINGVVERQVYFEWTVPDDASDKIRAEVSSDNDADLQNNTFDDVLCDSNIKIDTCTFTQIGNIRRLEVDISNTGMRDEEDIVLSLCDAEGNVLKTAQIDLLESGQSTWYSFDIDEYIVDSDIEFTVKAEGKDREYNLTDNERTAFYNPYFIYGDVSGDGNVNPTDAVMMLRKTAGLLDFRNVQKITGDLNDNGEIEPSDATKLLQYYAGIRSSVK